MKASVDYTIRDQHRMTQATNYFRWQYNLVKPHLGRRVLEIGCGVGNFTQQLLDREIVVAVDCEATCLDHLRKRFPRVSNLTVSHIGVADPAFLALHRFGCDTVVCLNVLEHIDDDTRALLQMKSILTTSGRIILIVPASPALYGPIDKSLGHYRRYSKPAVRELARAIGMTVVVLQRTNFVGFFGWWFNAKVLRLREQRSSQIAVFDKIVVPLLSRLEAKMEPPVGQNLLVVLNK